MAQGYGRVRDGQRSPGGRAVTPQPKDPRQLAYEEARRQWKRDNDIPDAKALAGKWRREP
jgi:hypothetical protein